MLFEQPCVSEAAPCAFYQRAWKTAKAHQDSISDPKAETTTTKYAFSVKLLAFQMKAITTPKLC